MSDSDSNSSGGPSESFFGLVVKPNKRYDTIVKKAFRVSKACIEPNNIGDKITSLYLEYDGDEFIIANLNKTHLNESLDLGFNLGEKISFKVDGPGTVHLTGNTIEEDDQPSFMGSFMDETMDNEVDSTPEVKSAKRKKEGSKKDAKKIKLDSSATSNGKADDEGSSSDDDEDDSDDDSSDDNDDETGGETTTLSDLDSTTNFAEEEDSEESDDGDSDEGEEEESEEDSDSDEEDSEDEKLLAPSPEKKKPAKMNGDVSPTKKAKLENAAQKSPKKEKKSEEAAAKSPKKEKKGEDAAQKNGEMTPKVDKKNKEAKTPKAEPKTPKQQKANDDAANKTPKQPKTPKDAAKTPKDAAKTPKDGGKTPKGEKTAKPGADGAAATPKSTKKTMKGGLVTEDLRIGTGPDVKPGRVVGMFYSGRLQTNNKQFDSCLSGKPFKFQLGKGEVIKGWDVGIMGMKVGGKRKLIIPPNMAYGSQGAPPDIPPNSTLVFEIECKYTK